MMTTPKNNKVLIRSMEGIGDQIYQRPFVKKLIDLGREVYVSTFLPQLYKDIEGCKFVDPRRKDPNTRTYRTQQKAFDSSFKYVKEPSVIGTFIDPFYKGEEVLHTSIVSNFYKKFGLDPLLHTIDWKLPDYSAEYEQKILEHKIVIPNRKIALIRPATVRKEWEVHTRNPDPNYINWCSKVLVEAGYFVISIADLSPDEFLVGSRPSCHMMLHQGELGVLGTLELIKRASIVVGGPGFIVPASISTGTPLFTIFGGRMAYDTPYKIFHPSMDLSKIGWAVPDNPCRCTLTIHKCDKTIKDLDTRFMEFLGRI